jgi:predicted phosphodiesterase
VRIGIVGDIHLPFEHPMYLRFCQDVFAAWQVDRVVLIGDIVDLHALSFWDHDPEGHSAEDESELAVNRVRKWHRTFEGADVMIGNHDERHYRVARKAGLPDRYLRSYKDVWRTPSWTWQYSKKIEGVNYEHGTCTGGKDGALNLAIQRRCSTVIGHIHTYPGVKCHANTDDSIFGMNVGCGIDVKAYAFAYGKAFAVRPVLGCGIVVDGTNPYFEPMPIGRGERYHRSRAGKQASPRKYIRERKVKE